MIIKSSAFKDGEKIPAKYTCEGDNVNPFLEIRNTPENTKSLVLIVDDPDATAGGVWDHWVVWNIHPKTQYIEEDTVPVDAVQGNTSFGSARYGGPCPPPGNTPHHYRFKVYALDTILNLSVDAGRREVEKAIEEHILEKAELIGVFGR